MSVYSSVHVKRSDFDKITDIMTIAAIVRHRKRFPTSRYPVTQLISARFIAHCTTTEQTGFM
jgi:hypothetical protein